jgi:HK97 family phage prohead protease
MNTKSYLLGGVEKKAGDNGSDIFTIIASTNAVDRQGDVVDQSGWDLTNFKKNPVLLWAHDYSALPIGKVVSAQVIKGQLIADFIFATADANPMAQQVKRLYEEGIVNASSVGFIPLERQGNVITRSELLELSLVPVPANQEALRRAVEKGFDADFIKTIEAKMEVIDKGAVAEEINAEEMLDAKYENWCKVMDVIQAFGCVYFDQNTPVDSFQTLLTETVDLLQQVADGESADTTTKVGKAIGSAEAKDFTPKEEKAGAKLSKESLAIIDKAMEAMGTGCTHLQNLKDSCTPKEASAEEVVIEKEVVTEKPTEAVQDTGSVEAEVVILSFAEVMENVQTLLRTNDKTNETVLAMVNKFVAKKKAETVA